MYQHQWRFLLGALAIGKYHHGNLRQVLVAEGRRLFEEIGATEMSLREVARRAGVSIAAPSRHFKGKEELLAAIATAGFAELVAHRVKTAKANADPLAKTREMMRSYVNFALANEGLFHLMIGPRILPKYRDQEFLAVSEKSFEYFASSVRELAIACGWPKSRLHFVTYAAWSLEHGVATLILAQMIPPEGRPKIASAALVDFAINLLLSSIMAGPDALERVKKPLGPTSSSMSIPKRRVSKQRRAL